MIKHKKISSTIINITVIILMVISLFPLKELFNRIYNYNITQGYKPNSFGYPDSYYELLISFCFIVICLLGCILILSKKKIGITIIRSFLLTSVILLTTKLIVDLSTYVGYVVILDILLYILFIFSLFVFSSKKILFSYFDSKSLEYYNKWNIVIVSTILLLGIALIVYW